MPIKKADLVVGGRYATESGEIRKVIEIIGKTHVSFVIEPEEMRQISAVTKFLKEVSLAPDADDE